MEDRYLFKAKRIDNGEWVIGFYVHIYKNHYIYTGQIIHGGLYDIAERFEIDPSTLCRCTGLKDKNGKLIWENDFLEYELGGVRIDSVKISSPIFSQTMRLNLQNYEIIGNIFDNPELLESEE